MCALLNVQHAALPPHKETDLLFHFVKYKDNYLLLVCESCQTLVSVFLLIQLLICLLSVVCNCALNSINKISVDL